jgi:hypothetical protein
MTAGRSGLWEEEQISHPSKKTVIGGAEYAAGIIPLAAIFCAIQAIMWPELDILMIGNLIKIRIWYA